MVVIDRDPEAHRARLKLTREQILAFRRRAGALDGRLPQGAESLRRAAWAGLQDSMPRAALLSLHARVEGTHPGSWEDQALVQLWGPRYSAYVVAAPDVAVFTLGRLPDAAHARARAESIASRLEAFLDGRRMSCSEAGHQLGVHSNSLRYAAPTGRLLIRWDGARQPTIWMTPAPEVDPRAARLELARRFLQVFGAATPGAFAEWAGITPPAGQATIRALGRELTPVRTPVGDGWILAADEVRMLAAYTPPSEARLLPSGDTYFLLQGIDRELLVPDPALRGQLWTPRVWPGALLIGGEIAGTWRRNESAISIQTWHALSPREREAVESEAASLPLASRVTVTWGG